MIYMTVKKERNKSAEHKSRSVKDRRLILIRSQEGILLRHHIYRIKVILRKRDLRETRCSIDQRLANESAMGHDTWNNDRKIVFDDSLTSAVIIRKLVNRRVMYLFTVALKAKLSRPGSFLHHSLGNIAHPVGSRRIQLTDYDPPEFDNFSSLVLSVKMSHDKLHAF